MTSGNDEIQVYKELNGFLVANRSDLRFAATEAVLQQPPEKLVQHGLIESLAKNASYDERPVATQALQALVQVTSHGPTTNQAVEDLMEAKGIDRMLEVVLSSCSQDIKDQALWRKQVNFAMALLANLTRTEAGAVMMVGTTLPAEAIPSSEHTEGKDFNNPTMDLLLSRFMSDQYVDSSLDYGDLIAKGIDLDTHSGDPYQHFSSVLMNVTQTEVGRRFVMRIRDERTVLQRLLPVLKSSNPLRRRGIAGLARNCCHDSDSAWWLLNVADITKYLLYPLAGPEELDLEEKQGLDPDLWLEGPDKRRETDRWARLFLVESILLLCASGRKSRETLRLKRTYVILKWADMVEEDEDINAQIYECVQLLRRDEEGTEEGSSDKFVADAYRSAAPVIGSSNDLDEMD